MKGSERLEEKLLNAYLTSHHGVISRSRALAMGLTEDQIDWRVRGGHWTVLHHGVYGWAGGVAGPEARLIAACLAAGDATVASHRSAAWVWGLVPSPPPRPELTTKLSSHPHVAGAVVHRRADLDAERTLVHHGVPVTDPLRTLADLGETVDGPALDDAVDRALATRTLTVTALETEVSRLGRTGRRGVPQLRAALDRRGLVHPLDHHRAVVAAAPPDSVHLAT